MLKLGDDTHKKGKKKGQLKTFQVSKEWDDNHVFEPYFFYDGYWNIQDKFMDLIYPKIQKSFKELYDIEVDSKFISHFGSRENCFYDKYFYMRWIPYTISLEFTLPEKNYIENVKINKINRPAYKVELEKYQKTIEDILKDADPYHFKTGDPFVSEESNSGGAGAYSFYNRNCCKNKKSWFMLKVFTKGPWNRKDNTESIVNYLLARKSIYHSDIEYFKIHQKFYSESFKLHAIVESLYPGIKKKIDDIHEAERRKRYEKK